MDVESHVGMEMRPVELSKFKIIYVTFVYDFLQLEAEIVHSMNYLNKTSALTVSNDTDNTVK